MAQTPGHRRVKGWWWLLFTLPLGLTTWAAFLWAGLRTRRRDLIFSGVVYGLLVVVALAWSTADPHGTGERVAEGVLPTLFIVGVVHALLVRRDVTRGLAAVDPARRAQFEYVQARRAYGRELLEKDPALARQLGVGRPDIAGIDSFGLVDVNHAGASALNTLPGLTTDDVDRVLAYRAGGDTFSSLEELARFLDLPPDVLAALGDAAIFAGGT